MRAEQSVRFGLFTYAAALVMALGWLGCAQVLGLEEWTEPGAGAGGAGGSGGSSSSDVSGSAGGTVPSMTTSTSAGGGDGGAGENGPTCADGVKNGEETAVDCGGDACGPCPDGAACAVDADCLGGSCNAGGVCEQATVTCLPVGEDPTCADCTQNGVETDVDCGGDTCLPCAVGQGCGNDADCLSAHCEGGQCVSAPPSAMSR